MFGKLFKSNIFKAAKRGDIDEVASFLANGVAVNSKNEYGWPLLCSAVSKGHFGLVAYLISEGADVNLATDMGVTPLSAIEVDNPLAAALLVVHGANVNPPPSKYGMTPLWDATYRGLPLVANYLIAHGAHIDAKDDMTGNTPLTLAAWKGLTDTVIYLLAKGANPNGQNNKRQTPLRYAVFHRDILMIEALITFGADPHIDAIDIAELQKDYAIANMLREQIGEQEKDYRKQKMWDMVEKIAGVAAQVASQL